MHTCSIYWRLLASLVFITLIVSVTLIETHLYTFLFTYATGIIPPVIYQNRYLPQLLLNFKSQPNVTKSNKVDKRLEQVRDCISLGTL